MASTLAAAVLFVQLAVGATPYEPAGANLLLISDPAFPPSPAGPRLSQNPPRTPALAQAPDVLGQCLRPAPGSTGPLWIPTDTQVATLETALVAFMTRRAVVDPDFAARGRDYDRQYIGIVRNGVRYIYGDFFAAGADWPPKSWSQRPNGCPVTSTWVSSEDRVLSAAPGWGILYRVDTRNFEELQLNDLE